MTEPSLLRPIPLRAFELAAASAESSAPPTPPLDSSSSSSYHEQRPSKESDSPSRTRSVLNLTSSTLFGIFSPTTNGDRDEPPTPIGAGAETPVRVTSFDNNSQPLLNWDESRLVQAAAAHRHHQHRFGFGDDIVPLVVRTVLLFTFGVAYGVIVTHLHDNHKLTPVKVQGIDGNKWPYLMFWGVAGVGLGSLLPWVDILWEEKFAGAEATSSNKAMEKGNGRAHALDEKAPSSVSANDSPGADWNAVARSVGAFVGVAFAIRKLPWQSTLQVSLTLALANPVLWYLIDRSKPGFVLSAAVGLTGTALLLNINPDMVPSPAIASPAASSGASSPSPLSHGLRHGIISLDSLAVATWIASVLFCSCVCFGNIGRRLALNSNRS